MPLNKPYLDIPGTTIFDAEQSRKGYWLNQFCMSLMKAENRARFKAGERAYLDEWPMTLGTGRGPQPSSAGVNSAAVPIANVGIISRLKAVAWSL